MVVVGCSGDKPISEDTAVDPEDELCPSLAASPEGPAVDNGTGCTVTFPTVQYPNGDSQDPCFPDLLQGFTIDGMDPAPSSVTIVMPGSCLQGVDVVFNTVDTDPGTDFDWQVDANNGICGSGDQASGDPSCNTYPVAQNVYEIIMPYPPGGDCDDIDTDEMFLTPRDEEDTCDEDVESMAVNTGCTPGVAVPLDLVYWKLFDLNDDGTFHAMLQPIQMSGASYSERAWLRKVVVTDWGDATELHVRGFGEPWVVSKTDIIDPAHSLALNSGNTPKTLPVGKVTMGTTWSIDGVTPTNSYFELPKIEVDWTCQYNPQNLHFLNTGASQAYAKTLGSMGFVGMNYSQRLILRFPSTSVGTLEIEGRSSDRLQFDLTPVSAGVFSFNITNTARDGSALSGTITASGTDRVVTFTELVLQGDDLGTPSMTFPEYP